MLVYKLILSGMILMCKNSLHDIVVCQDVSIQTTRTVNYMKDTLKLGCTPTNVKLWNGISAISLSKNTSSGFRDIVHVVLDLKLFRNQTNWMQSGWWSRGIVIKEYVYPLSSSGLEFYIPANRVVCSDEGTYRCTVIGSTIDNSEVVKVKIDTVQLTVKPTTINQIQIHPQQPDAIYVRYTVVLLRCTGTVGRDPAGEIRWCYRRDDMFNFIGWPNLDDYDQGMLISNDCQNSRTSTLRYNVSADYQYTEFRCETGGTTMVCGHSSAIASNITIYRYSEPMESTTITYVETTDSEPMESTTITYVETTVCSSDINTILISCIAILIALILIGFAISVMLYKKGIIVIKWKKERIYGDTKARTKAEHVYDSTTEYHMYNTAEG
ncbi:uncharacterized protein [Mytilus edulis]|uniref:uncharacterized protein n=1 Tax=Mytilus edulis TaxID=6550 RepID=UPI0039F12974